MAVVRRIVRRISTGTRKFESQRDPAKRTRQRTRSTVVNHNSGASNRSRMCTKDAGQKRNGERGKKEASSTKFVSHWASAGSFSFFRMLALIGEKGRSGKLSFNNTCISDPVQHSGSRQRARGCSFAAKRPKHSTLAPTTTFCANHKTSFKRKRSVKRP